MNGRRILSTLVVAATLVATTGGVAAGQGVAAGREVAAARVVPAAQAPTSSVAIVPRADGSRLVFFRGEDNGLYVRTWSATGWSAQTALGGVLVGPPTATATTGTDLIVAARGADGALWTRGFVAGAWQAWQGLGGIMSAAPTVAGYPDGRVDVFIRSADYRLYTRSRAPDGAWSAWSSLGGVLASGPAAVAYGVPALDVFITGANNQVYRRSRTTSGWSAWASFGGPQTYVAPAAARIAGTGGARVFIRGATDNALHVNEAGVWASLGGGVIDAPAAVGTATGTDVVVRGTDLALFGRTLRDGTWSAYARAWIPAAPTPPASGLLGTDWTTIPTTAKVMALTFDAGGNANGLASILATLATKNVPASFFLTGSFSRTFPAQANRVAISGVPIGNHTDTHPDLTTLSDAQVRAQVLTAQSAIRLANGADSRPLFRFPFGAVNARVIGVVNGQGYVPVRWSTDSLGWQGTSGGQSRQAVVNRVVAGARPGGIVLMHVGSNPTDGTSLDADALPAIVDGLRAKGYRFVTLDALTG